MAQEELQIISQAILNEEEGYEFYKMAAESSTGKSKQTFLRLAEEELKHAVYLKKLAEKLADNQEDKSRPVEGLVLPSPDLYSWDRFDELQKKRAMSIFSIAMTLEQAAVDFYQHAKDQTESDAARDTYDTLIQWEKIHYHQFKEEYNYYRKLWLEASNIEPF